MFSSLLSIPTHQELFTLLASLAVFIGFYLLAQLAKGFFMRLSKGSASLSRAYTLYWLARIIKIIVIGIGLIATAATLGMDVSALLTSLGLLLVAAGFAMKDSIANSLAGTWTLIYPPFYVGDYIKIAGFEGKVSAMTLRHVSLSNQEEVILIPNTMLLTQAIVINKAIRD